IKLFVVKICVQPNDTPPVLSHASGLPGKFVPSDRVRLQNRLKERVAVPSGRHTARLERSDPALFPEGLGHAITVYVVIRALSVLWEECFKATAGDQSIYSYEHVRMP